MIFDDKIFLSRNRLEVISGNLVFLSNSKKRMKLIIKIVRKNIDEIGILVESNCPSLMSKLSDLRNVMNNRNELMVTPNKIEPFKSNFW